MPFNIDRETKKPPKETYIDGFFDSLWACATVTIVVRPVCSLGKDILFCNFWRRIGIERISNVYGFWRYYGFIFGTIGVIMALLSLRQVKI